MLRKVSEKRAGEIRPPSPDLRKQAEEDGNARREAEEQIQTEHPPGYAQRPEETGP